MKRMLLLLLLCMLVHNQGLWAQEERTQVLVETSKGKLVLELYNETPKHRDNFLRMVESKAYDGVVFHRVIREFVVQGGNLNSKGLGREQELPDDSISGVIPAEIMTDLFVHERGALAAARQSDEVNPGRVSSASQFYIVTGKYHTAFDLEEIMSQNGIKYTEAQKEGYMMRGGTPSLDGAYTVFGRLIEGWKVIDKIQRVETDEVDRPIKDIVIKSMSIYIPKKKKK
ncbi:MULTISPECIES: peptidylprolyl isomerase [unclassified Porphyromonas]|uniref:peptidylprolyl isomerase n=1 Tax=unclassified Porphyromonas TaxID=2645799 RepID=UPI00052BE73E|nr:MULTISPECIES: peptidylprolyl isomerase [unclassified Porphyromonas]KGN86500.1 peptidylprolyl isomerase [Porphyromonas sp. COT-290 OH860]KGO00772.1 peptidylprolyl isomerase [Porphyromonas sp. COT-290 OH3588]